MNQDRQDSSFDRPFLPPKASAGPGLWSWVVSVVALIVLAVVAYQAYLWLAGDVERRRALAQHAIDMPQNAASAALADNGGATPPSRLANGEPPAPAVVGGVNKCLTNGQVIYTNAACPEGSSPLPGAPAGEPVPVATQPAVASSGGAADPSQQQADCNFLSAETARLDYEFHQTLPPPVLDRISTQLTDLREQAAAARCAPPPKAGNVGASASPGRPRAPARVADE